MKALLFSLLIFFFISSCSRDDNQEDIGVRTELKGRVSDNIRDININGYKIKLVKSWSSCNNWLCGIASEEVATTYTDSDGNYSIIFNYKLKDGESYGLEEQYYGIPFYPEYPTNSTSNGIQKGQTNILNINAWQPILLKLNLNVSNNTHGPLHVRNEIGNSNESFLNTENIYEQNIIKTYNLRSKPDSDIKIIFWYYKGTNSNPILFQKVFLYHTTFDDINELNFNIDCSTF